LVRPPLDIFTSSKPPPHVSWGDYRTEPPLPEDVLAAEEPEQAGEDGKRKKKDRRTARFLAQRSGEGELCDQYARVRAVSVRAVRLD
jgi:hypothetical protein